MRRKRVGYAKLGRSMQLRLEKCSSLGGDNEMVPTLKLLAEAYPDTDFVIVGRNSGEAPADVGLPSNVYNPWSYWAGEVRKDLNRAGLSHPNLSVPEHYQVRDIIDAYTGPAILDCDDVVMWIGQHGTSNMPLPGIKDRTKLTKPYDWATLYAGYLIHGINRWRNQDPHNFEEILLNSDSRNYVKYRDMKWPLQHPVISQYDFDNNAKHERFGDESLVLIDQWHALGVKFHDGLWTSTVQNTYDRLEISSLLPGTPFGDTVFFNGDWDRPHDFGIVINETRREVAPQKSRLRAMKDWVMPLSPGFVHGVWSEASRVELDLDIQPVPILEYIPKLQTTRCTFTTPASGSGWATAKPWEAFAAGTVCFFHPMYDDQNQILDDAPIALNDFLRVRSPKELRRRIEICAQDEETFQWVINQQRRHFEKATAETTYLQRIEERLHGAAPRAL